MIKIWPFLFVLPVENDAFLDVYIRFWKFQEASQSCKMLQLCVER